MALALQYDLFAPIESEYDEINKRMEALADSQNRQRKTLFGKHHELVKLVLNQQKEIDHLRELVMKGIK